MSGARRRVDWRMLAGATLRVTGWLAVTALAAAGLIALMFFALGNFSLPQTMAQLANLADRYMTADGPRQAQFDRIVGSGFALAATAVCFFRRASFAHALRTMAHDPD